MVGLSIGGGLFAAALAVGALLVANQLGDGPMPEAARTPETTVTQESAHSPVATAAQLTPAIAFLDALVSGDLQQAIAASNDPTAFTGPLLGSDVFNAAGHATGYEILDANIDGLDAEVTALLVFGSEAAEVQLSLAREAVPSEWHLTGVPFAALRVEGAGTAFDVNGVGVELPGAPDGAVFTALPGVYTFSAMPDSVLFAYGTPQTVTVTPAGATASVRFERSLSPSAPQAAIDAVQSRIDSCMGSDQFRPRDCPNVLEMEDPLTFAVTGITRSWLQAPTLRFVTSAADPAVPEGTYGVRVTGGDLDIAYRWRVTESDAWQPADLMIHSTFDRTSPDGVLVPVTFDPMTGVAGDFSAF